MNNPILETIKSRRSIRKYTAEQIKEEELQTILEAGMWAPSAGNSQGWHFTVVQQREVLDWLNRSAKEAAKKFEIEYIQKMANNEKLNVFYNAPTVVVVSGDASDTEAVEANCAAATQNMLLAAEALGLGACWVNFIRHPCNFFAEEDRTEFLQKLGIPQGYKPYSSIVLGYKKYDASVAPERKPNLVNYIR